jgi:EmrB/QacA subfamily drug resistance transporter
MGVGLGFGFRIAGAPGRRRYTMIGQLTSTVPPALAERGHRWRWAGLAVLLVAEAMNLLDSTIVQVAAPVIHADLGGAVSGIQWFSAAYTLAFALVLITGGRLGDIAGRRRVFRIGVAGFVLASLACACSPTADVLTGARIVQGACAALAIPQTFGLIRAMFAGPETAKALGTIGPVMGLAAVCGPVLGGVLTHADVLGLSWRAVFLVNVPLGAAVLAGIGWLCEDRAAHRPRLDFPGTALATTGTGLLVYPLVQADTAGMPTRSWLSIGIGLAVLAGFGVHQRARARRGRTPLVEPGLLARRGFRAALAASTLFFSVMTGLMLVTVLYLQLGTGAGTLTAGLSMLPWSAGLAVSSWIAGAGLVGRFGWRLMPAGLGVLLLGVLGAVAACRAAGPAGYPWPLLGPLAICGLGLGLFTVPFFTIALREVRPEETGSAAGLLNAVQQLGGTLGVALLGSVFLRAAGRASSGGAGVAALIAMQRALWLSAALIVAAAVAAVFMAGPRQNRSVQAQPQPLTAATAPRPAADGGGSRRG